MKRTLSFVLALMMLIGLMPMQALASENEVNPWEGRSAVFVGDSITAGSGTTKIYYEYLEESLGFDSVTPMGVAGSCISAASDYGQSNQPLINRYQDIPSADLLVVFMGTNDYGHETPLGSVEDTQDGTFYGALNTIVPALVANHPSSKIVFVTPLHRYGFGTSNILGTAFTSDNVANGVGATLGDYVDAVKTVCANNGVSVIDLYTECALDPADAETRTNYMPDGLHPNAAGHEMIAGIMASHIRGFEPAEQEPVELTEMVYGNRFAAGNNQTCRASSRINYYLKAGTVITLKDSAAMQWACTKTSDETSSSNLGYFPDSAWSDKETAVVEADGWVGFVFKYRDETQVFDLSKPLSGYITIEEPVSWDDVNTDALYNTITVTPGQLMPEGNVVENEIYGYVVNYPLKKGHVLSISNADYVFSVRKLVDGNYSTMLKQATVDSFTATEDMTVAMLIRKPDKSAMTAEELASIVIYDSQFGMIGVEGSVKRFTVEAETIDGGTATTRAAIFLPESYTETGTPTRLIIMTNGGSAYLTESSWQGNTEANRNLVEFYLQNGYAVLVNDNTAGKVVNNTSGMVPDLGCLQQLSGLMKSYEYVRNALNLERQFSIHARSQGTFVGIRIMREYPELVKCALITGPNVSAAHRWTVIANKDHTAKRFGFDDLTGNTFEADKFVGNDIYTDMAAEDYSLPPTFWMESNNDVCPNNNKSIYEVVERLRELGCTAEYQKFSDLTHSETCRLASEEATAAALAFLEKYQESHTHSYTPAVTAPTCTEQGYTTYTCDCGDSYVDDYVDATGHTYEKGTCTGCGAENPNLANYEGKVISILGDSISTFAGYIPTADGFNLEHIARYPQDNLLTDVNETWWMQLLTELDAKLGINESWRSTEVGNIYDVEVNSGYEGTKACMASLTRIQNLGSNGTPDVILFYGGTNDITQRRTVGTFDPATAPTEVDLTSVKWDTVADAYVAAIMRMQYYYPDAEIIAMLPTFTSRNTDSVIEKYNSVFAAICEHYGVTYIDLRYCGIATSDLPDGTHPDAEGMDYITEAVLEVLMNECDMSAGEHIVHTVTHELAGAEASHSYYKGISDGSTFKETVTGEDLVVTVTMGGKDVTASVYSDGVIHISAVTGDVVITAIAKEKPIYADYLQEIPDDLCFNVNLWDVLEHDNIYYTSSGWGNLSGNTVYSVTIPVSSGDRIWATSFQAKPLNGNTTNSTNGIRVTWFSETGVLKSMSPAETYAEFTANGYLTAPEGAVAFNIPMWNGNEDNEIYLLNRDHCYENGVCVGCGEAQPGPVITQQPENVSAAIGEKFAVTVEAEGEGLTYQWYYSNDGGKSFAVSSFKSKTYAMTMATYCHNRQIYCVITDANGNSIQTDTVTITAPLTITKQPADVQVEIGQKASISVSAVGDGLRYQWYYKDRGSKEFKVSSYKGKTYSMTMAEWCHMRQVYCVITDAYGNTVTTEIATMSRPPLALTIVTQPQDVQVEIGEKANITVVVQGEGLTYQWYYKDRGNKEFKVSSYKGNTYSMKMAEFCHGRQVYCVITDQYGNSVTSETATMTRPPVELKILTQPTGITAAVGEKFSVRFTVQGEGLTYQWYYKNKGDKTFKVSSFTGDRYSMTMASFCDGRQVYCVITDQYGNQVTTEVVTLTVEK